MGVGFSAYEFRNGIVNKMRKTIFLMDFHLKFNPFACVILNLYSLRRHLIRLGLFILVCNLRTLLSVA